MELTRKQWLAVAGVAVWLVVVIGLGVWAAHGTPATVREQSDLTEGRQALDRAVEALRSEATAQDIPVQVEPYEVRTGCRLSLVWRGTEVERAVVLSVPPGEETSALGELRPHLPAEWAARFNPDTGRFSADAGDFVQVVGEPGRSGEVRVTVATGCRPGDDPVLDS